MIHIHPMTAQTLSDAATLAARVYSTAVDELLPAFIEAMDDPQQQTFLAFEDSTAVAFAQVTLRHDYVEGTGTSPVGYLEGIYVSPSHRRQGLARKMVETCKGWAKEQGCSEFASDTQLHNVESQAFHQALGFIEAGRIVCYTQQL